MIVRATINYAVHLVGGIAVGVVGYYAARYWLEHRERRQNDAAMTGPGPIQAPEPAGPEAPA